ncbi:MAG: TetR/AcrR family transcriptional regulator [Desulfobacterales bacterium]|nr:TetR/AcrR family transcriptional regulator [Desulfobacterales bacterium]
MKPACVAPQSDGTRQIQAGNHGVKQRRHRERAERRRQILDAARHLLLEKGLAATSVNQIARIAELSIGTVYFYFENKEDIFAALQAEGLEILDRDVLAACRSAADPETKLVAVAGAYYRFSEVHRNYFNVIHYFLSATDVVFSPVVKEKIDRNGSRILHRVEAVIAEGVAAGCFRPVAAGRYALLFWGLIHGLIPFRKMRATLLAAESHRTLYNEAVANFIAGLKYTDASPDIQPLGDREE